MHGYVADIEELTEENTDYRRVLYSGGKRQLVLMSIGNGEEIGGGVHHRDQLVQATKAEAEASEEVFNGQASEKPTDVVRA